MPLHNGQGGFSIGGLEGKGGIGRGGACSSVGCAVRSDGRRILVRSTRGSTGLASDDGHIVAQNGSEDQI